MDPWSHLQQLLWFIFLVFYIDPRERVAGNSEVLLLLQKELKNGALNFFFFNLINLYIARMCLTYFKRLMGMSLFCQQY